MKRPCAAYSAAAMDDDGKRRKDRIELKVSKDEPPRHARIVIRGYIDHA